MKLPLTITALTSIVFLCDFIDLIYRHATLKHNKFSTNSEAKKLGKFSEKIPERTIVHGIREDFYEITLVLSFDRKHQVALTRPRIGHTDIVRSFFLKKDVHCRFSKNLDRTRCAVGNINVKEAYVENSITHITQ